MPLLAGFDMLKPPGPKNLELMQRLIESGAFSWAGYYLAPTNAVPKKTKDWMGTREILTEQGWGLVPLYWGSQVNDKTVAAWAKEKTPADREKKARKQGKKDSQDAAELAAKEGFPHGTKIYLDVEPEGATVSQTIRDSYAAYVDEWFATLWDALGSGLDKPHYFPAFYGHVRDVIANTYSSKVLNSDRWLCGGRKAVPPGEKNDNVLLDAWGWPLTPEPYDAGRPCTMWQWAQDVTLKKSKAGYSVTDYDGTVHKVVGALDYDSSADRDPADSKPNRVIEVSDAATENKGHEVGGRDARVRVYLNRPAARPLGTDVEVTDGKRTKRGHVEPGKKEVVVPVPTDPVDVPTPVTYSARTAWWRHSREHAGMNPATEPPAKTATQRVRPPHVVDFFITPRVKVGDEGTGTIVLEEIPTPTYRVQLSSTDTYNGALMLEDVPAEVGFTGKETTFKFKGAAGPSGDGFTARITLNSVVNSTWASTKVSQ